GRIFYILDEGLRNHIYLPARWTVVARDAFNGKILWKRKIDKWWPHTTPFKSGPGVLPRRIVALGNRVYVTLGIDAPLTALDAATGQTVHTYKQTKGTCEIVLDKGVLYLVAEPDKGPFPYKHASDNRGKERDRVNQEFGWSKDSAASVLMAVAADSGRVLWRHKDEVAPTTLAVAGERIVYFDGERVVALNRADGERKWTSENAGNWAIPATGYTARLIVGDGVIIVSTRRGIGGGRLVGVSAENGKVLWSTSQLKSGHFSPEDLFLIGGVVWTAQTGKSQVTGTKFQGVDAKTGETRFDFVAEQIEAFFMHQRCYPGRATERYIMASGTGTEFLELGTENCEIHHWLRGNCLYGIMPCNGLIYKSPDRCACYYQSKLHHLCALAPAGDHLPRGAKSSRLEKGPAYGAVARPASHSAEWPAYRHDNTRSGTTTTKVTAKPAELWKTEIGGKLSTLTTAAGKVFVAAVDQHTVYALAGDTGKKVWYYTAGGRVDSPPSIHQGNVVFGCADGWVYCLRISDGELAWRFRAAPGPDKLISYEQPESVWPVHGSVLIREGVVYALAGRNIFLDGGMHLVRLDCATGKLLGETVMDDKDPATGKNAQTLIAGKAMPVANADIFSCDKDNIYMGSQRFDFAGKRVDIAPAVGKERVQTGPGRHLFCPTGFLDEDWFHRTYFMYGINAGEGHGEYATARSFAPVGRIMVFDDSKIYSLFAHNVGNNINPRTHYSLFAVAKNPPASGPVPQPEPSKKRQARNPKRKQPKKPAPVAKNKQQSIWEIENVGILANAMVLAGDKLFLAGVPDVADETKTRDYIYGADDELNRQLIEQEKAWLGEKGALLWVVSAETGTKLGEYKIPAVPVWDGMIAADRRLYLATRDGYIRCME
ncbi:MAG: outer membrane protein assembly factor BamB family protein, partial [Planctomycetota bacterium]